MSLDQVLHGCYQSHQSISELMPILGSIDIQNCNWINNDWKVRRCTSRTSTIMSESALNSMESMLNNDGSRRFVFKQVNPIFDPLYDDSKAICIAGKAVDCNRRARLVLGPLSDLLKKREVSNMGVISSIRPSAYGELYIAHLDTLEEMIKYVEEMGNYRQVVVEQSFYFVIGSTLKVQTLDPVLLGLKILKFDSKLPPRMVAAMIRHRSTFFEPVDFSDVVYMLDCKIPYACKIKMTTSASKKYISDVCRIMAEFGYKKHFVKMSKPSEKVVQALDYVKDVSKLSLVSTLGLGNETKMTLITENSMDTHTVAQECCRSPVFNEDEYKLSAKDVVCRINEKFSSGSSELLNLEFSMTNLNLIDEKWKEFSCNLRKEMNLISRLNNEMSGLRDNTERLILSERCRAKFDLIISHSQKERASWMSKRSRRGAGRKKKAGPAASKFLNRCSQSGLSTNVLNVINLKTSAIFRNFGPKKTYNVKQQYFKKVSESAKIERPRTADVYDIYRQVYKDCFLPKLVIESSKKLMAFKEKLYSHVGKFVTDVELDRNSLSPFDKSNYRKIKEELIAKERHKMYSLCSDKLDSIDKNISKLNPIKWVANFTCY